MPIQSRKRSHKLYVSIIALIVLVCGFGLLELTGVTHVIRKDSKPLVSASQNTKGESFVSNNKSVSPTDTTANTSQPGDQKSNSGGTSSDATLLAPTGDLVSNHHPNLSGTPAPSILTSVCTSTPGAICQISFTNGSSTKVLPAQTTDRGGSTYWNNWKLQDLGLTAGEWKITASASLDGKSQSTVDALNLEVAQ